MTFFGPDEPQKSQEYVDIHKFPVVDILGKKSYLYINEHDEPAFDALHSLDDEGNVDHILGSVPVVSLSLVDKGLVDSIAKRRAILKQQAKESGMVEQQQEEPLIYEARRLSVPGQFRTFATFGIQTFSSMYMHNTGITCELSYSDDIRDLRHDEQSQRVFWGYMQECFNIAERELSGFANGMRNFYALGKYDGLMQTQAVDILGRIIKQVKQLTVIEREGKPDEYLDFHTIPVMMAASDSWLAEDALHRLFPREGQFDWANAKRPSGNVVSGMYNRRPGMQPNISHIKD
jgi:hypothetical protein